MRKFKVFAIIAAAALLLAPATAMARSHFSFSLNLFDRAPMFAPAPPPVVFAPTPVYLTCYPRPYAPPRTIVKEYHHYYMQAPNQCDEEEYYEVRPYSPHHNRPFQCR